MQPFSKRLQRSSRVLARDRVTRITARASIDASSRDPHKHFVRIAKVKKIRRLVARKKRFVVGRVKCAIRATRTPCGEPLAVSDEPLRFTTLSAYARTMSAIPATSEIGATPAKANRNAMFWVLHSLCWLAYAVSHYLGALIYSKPVGYMKVIVAGTLAGFVVSVPLRYVCRRLWRYPPLLALLGALAAAYVAALVWRLALSFAYLRYLPESFWATSIADYFSGTVQAAYLMASWVGAYFGFRYYESTQLQREATLRASTLAQEAQLKMLRYQLNPHFLFNTLNAISTLILDQRNQTANSAVTGLSEFLRYTLDQDPMKRVTVAQEIEALNLYLDIEKLRFGHRLTLIYRIEPLAMQALVPSLVLQPLIENAIKYAVAPREQGGTITIAGEMSGQDLRLAVTDDGPGMADPTRLQHGRGVGIRNTRERLQVLYGERGRVELMDARPGLRVQLTVPAEFAETRSST
jgi:two-component system, LytTR family, sensor kinase